MRVGLLAFACFDLGDGGLDQPGALGVGEHGQPALPDFTASWWLWSPCWTCYFAPNICSLVPTAGGPPRQLARLPNWSVDFDCRLVLSVPIWRRYQEQEGPAARMAA